MYGAVRSVHAGSHPAGSSGDPMRPCLLLSTGAVAKGGERVVTRQGKPLLSPLCSHPDSFSSVFPVNPVLSDAQTFL